MSTMVELPDENTRWRCSQCGNLTRFDVQRTTTAREYWHADLGGEPAIEERTVLSETVSSVVCRWCGATDAIELIPRAAAE